MKNAKIVTLVREPVSRNVSAFFDLLEVNNAGSGERHTVKSGYGFEVVVDAKNPQELEALFLEKFDHETPLVFFDREFKGELGIDVFSGEFPTSKGYQIIENEKAQVLLLRLEDLNKCGPGAFKEFLDIDGFSIVKANVGNEKPYNNIYRNFLNTAVLPQSYLDEMYNSKYTRHFYSSKEISRFRAKWNRQPLSA